MEELINLHGEGGHFVNELESLSGLRSLEAQDFEIGSGILLSEGLNPNIQPLVDEDGSLTIHDLEKSASQVLVKLILPQCTVQL